MGTLFRTKSPELLMREAAAPERKLKRSLTVLDLTCLGIGAIIGAGIFALAGTAAAGEAARVGESIVKTPVLNFIEAFIRHSDLVFGRPAAGPAVAVSFVVAAIACGFAALCYSELAAMIPVSGSAYTYSYATLGEIVAWIIGWDLILEYAVGNMAVAKGWSDYFVKLFFSLSHGSIKFPLWLVTDPTTAATKLAQGGEAVQYYSALTVPHLFGYPIALDLPALLIVAAVTVLLIYGIRESATTNTTIVLIKVAVVIFVIAFGAFMVHPTNWHPFAPSGFGGIMGGAAIVFFAFIGFDAVSTTAEETKNPQRDLPIGMITSLIICTVLYVLMSAVLTGIKKYTVYLGDSAAVATAFASKPWAQALVSAGALAGLTSVLPHSACHYHLDWPGRRRGSHAYRYRFVSRLNEYRDAVCLRPCLLWGRDFAPQRSHAATAIPRAIRTGVSTAGCAFVFPSDAKSSNRNLVAFLRLADHRPGNLFPLQCSPQPPSDGNRCRRD